MTTYDENINDNPFHEALVKNHFDLLEKISSEGWIVCIPRIGSIKNIEDSDLYEHILLPATWMTLNKTKVHLSNDTVIIENENGGSNCIKILFKETFYYQRLKYLIYCIERPLNENTTEPVDGSIDNLRDCIDFLWTETWGREILIKINAKCEAFIKENENLQKSNLKSLNEQSQVLYNQCFLLALNSKRLCGKEKDKIFMWKLRLSTETYMQHCLNDCVFQAICANTSHADANFNKTVRNLQEVELKDFDVPDYSHCVQDARSELNKINNFITTLGKITCLRRTFEIFSKNNCQNLTCEDLLQLFVFIIIKLNISNWIANLVYMQKFVFYSAEESDEHGFLITTLEAAIEYIKSGVLHEVRNDTSQNNLLFDSIRICDLNKIEGILKDVPKQEIKLCHPLCSCDKCEQLISEEKEYTINTYDCKGRNALHIACMYGYPHLVDFFIHKGVDSNTADYSGNKPIHYCASRGHQNALLLLLHSGADLNAVDADGNTPLHLACNNGHENCVKALLYYSEHTNDLMNVSQTNNLGYTPLHSAAKWGYLNIVSILIQYNVDITIKNNKKQTALDIAHNCYVKRLLLSTKEVNDDFTNDKNVHTKDFSYGVTEHNSSFGIRPKNLQQFKKVGLLLKAIENNDLPLSSFHLGIPTSPSPSDEKLCCHPLCLCDKCRDCDDHEMKFQRQPQEILNFNMCNANGWTPLHVAAKYGRKEILRLLLDAGANVNLQVYRTLHTPLHIACIYQHVGIVKELLESGNCDIDIQDNKGNTASHYACFKNDVKILDVLLTKGADVSIKNANNKTVLQEAEDKLLFNVIKLVKDKGTVSVFKNDKFVLI